jgi:hypothetical protein
MALRSQLSPARICAQVWVIGCSLAVPCASHAGESRPPLSQACLAWNGHIADLIDQQRVANDLDDEQLSNVIRLFNDARSACTASRFAEGLAIYDVIPIGQVRNHELR